MARSLYVPVHLHAKLIMSGGASVDPPALGGNAFAPPPGAPLAAGVHLHWALPDALTRGEIDSQGVLCFPALPDRWLVIRFASVSTSAPSPTEMPPRRAYKVFELDAKNPSATLQSLGSVPFASPRDPKWLTALGLLAGGKATGPGSITSQQHLDAAYYATSKGRFGGHDNLSDLGSVDWNTLHLSYLVIGHYVDSAEDPLGRIEDEVERNKWVEARKLYIETADEILRYRSPLVGSTTTPFRPIGIGGIQVLDTQGQISAIDDSFFQQAASEVTTGPRFIDALHKIESAQNQSNIWTTKLAQQINDVAPVAFVSEDRDEFPTRIVCHGAIVDLGPGGEYVRPNASNGFVDVVEGMNVAVDEALLGIGGGEVLSLLREGIDGNVTSPAGQQALGHLLHASSFDGAPDIPDEPEFDYSVVLSDSASGSAPAWNTLDDGTPIRIIDRRSVSDTNLPTGIFAEQLDTFIASLPNNVQVAYEQQPRVRPRWYRPSTPVLRLSGQGRSFRHGHDGRMRSDGRLLCRAGGQTIKRLSIEVPEYPSAQSRLVGDMLVTLGFDLRIQPAFVQELVYEHVLLDPTNAPRATALWLRGVQDQSTTAVTKGYDAFRRATQGWWASADPTLGTTPPAAGGFTGTLPSPVAVTPWTDPWLPLFADIEYNFTSYCESKANVALDAIDSALTGTVTNGATVSAQAREVLSSTLSTTLASAIDRLRKETTTTPKMAEDLAQISRGLGNLDLMTVGFAELDLKLRAAGRAFRGGRLCVTRVRLVDTFGNTRILVDTNAPKDCMLPPRLTHWARVEARLTQADKTMSSVAPDANSVQSPLAGFLVYDAIEHAVEFFQPTGEPLGQLRHDRVTTQVSWEGAPGRTQVNTITQPVMAVVDQVLRTPAVAGSLSKETGLSAALEVFSVARKSVAPKQPTDDHLSLICGRPIAVLRARFDLRLAGIGASDQPSTSAPAVAPDGIRVRLGSLDQMDDGLLGFMMQGPSGWRLHVVPQYANLAWKDPYIVVHPIICKDTSFELAPNAPREVILLLDGISAFHVQAGLLPRKRIDPTEVISARVMSKLLPTVRVGPLLMGETNHRLPSATLPNRSWSFVEPAKGATFTVTPLDPFAPALSEIPDAPLRFAEGWLRLDPKDP